MMTIPAVYSGSGRRGSRRHCAVILWQEYDSNMKSSQIRIQNVISGNSPVRSKDYLSRTGEALIGVKN
jgi:hypothetical protein